MQLEKIDSLESLREARKQLRIESEVCLHAFSRSNKMLGKGLKDFTVSKLAIPVGIIAAVGLIFNLSEKREKTQDKESEGSFFKTISPLLMPIFEGILRRVSEMEKQEPAESV
ncbi:MAG: hypothetical protein KDC69_10940 [Flavobacteriaceae bacterium]|nr:hypothetical protein [Flavobacteriaceae bacterium]MCB0706100.1 hypothetical protein [Saprospiraceae bacterium]